VTIRTKEPDVPSDFPPARLFLDDMEEIVRVLVDALENSTENTDEEGRPLKDKTKTRVTLTTKDRVCDGVRELPAIAKRTTELSVTVRSERSALPEASLSFRKSGANLRLRAFSRDESLSTFHNLEPIFKRRSFWLARFAHSYPNLFGLLTFALYICAAVPLVPLLNKQTPSARAILIGLPAAAIIITVLATSSHHSTIILRRSSEPSPLSQNLLQKIPLMVITSVLTFLLTLLGFYLKHKYWP